MAYNDQPIFQSKYRGRKVWLLRQNPNTQYAKKYPYLPHEKLYWELYKYPTRKNMFPKGNKKRPYTGRQWLKRNGYFIEFK